MPGGSVPGIIALVQKLEGGPWFTIRDVCDQVDRHETTVKGWLKQHPELQAKKKVLLGKKGKHHVWVYTQAEIDRIKEYSAKIHYGRPKKEEE